MNQLISELEKATGFSGNTLVVYLVTLLVAGLLLLIATWKIFTKAGQAGWKCLIPIYNAYVFCKIIHMNFWVWVIILPFIVGGVSGFLNGDHQKISVIITVSYMVIMEIVMARKLAKAFGKGFLFTFGLILCPGLFELILGFGSSKYKYKA